MKPTYAKFKYIYELTNSISNNWVEDGVKFSNTTTSDLLRVH